MNASTVSQSKGLPARLFLLLLAGDALVVLTFSIQGRVTHRLSQGSLVVGALSTAGPFFAAWFVVALLLWRVAGGERALDSLWRWWAHAALITVIAVPLGVALRALLLSRPIILMFMLVSISGLGAMMLVWRGIFWWIQGKLA
jgi:hypothetical protein